MKIKELSKKELTAYQVIDGKKVYVISNDDLYFIYNDMVKANAYRINHNKWDDDIYSDCGCLFMTTINKLRDGKAPEGYLKWNPKRKTTFATYFASLCNGSSERLLAVYKRELWAPVGKIAKDENGQKVRVRCLDVECKKGDSYSQHPSQIGEHEKHK